MAQPGTRRTRATCASKGSRLAASGIQRGLAALLLVAAAAGAEGAPDPVRVLIIDGFSNHDWRTTTARLREILAEAGGFVVTVSTSPDSRADPAELAAWRPPLDGIEVVLLNCNDLGRPVNWNPVVRTGLEDFVRGGGGLYAFHSANNAFAQWPAYNRMIGLGWRKSDFGVALTVADDGRVRRVPAGEGPGTSHGPRVDAQIIRLGDHPIHAGLPRTWRASDLEVYTYARGPAEDLEVLSYSKDNAFGLGFPIEWVVRFGRGRVYTSTFGHLWADDPDPAGFRSAEFRGLVVAALRWLAGREEAIP